MKGSKRNIRRLTILTAMFLLIQSTFAGVYAGNNDIIFGQVTNAGGIIKAVPKDVNLEKLPGAVKFSGVGSIEPKTYYEYLGAETWRQTSGLPTTAIYLQIDKKTDGTNYEWILVGAKTDKIYVKAAGVEYMIEYNTQVSSDLIESLNSKKINAVYFDTSLIVIDPPVVEPPVVEPPVVEPPVVEPPVVDPEDPKEDEDPVDPDPKEDEDPVDPDPKEDEDPVDPDPKEDEDPVDPDPEVEEPPVDEEVTPDPVVDPNPTPEVEEPTNGDGQQTGTTNPPVVPPTENPGGGSNSGNNNNNDSDNDDEDENTVVIENPVFSAPTLVVAIENPGFAPPMNEATEIELPVYEAQPEVVVETAVNDNPQTGDISSAVQMMSMGMAALGLALIKRRKF